MLKERMSEKLAKSTIVNWHPTSKYKRQRWKHAFARTHTHALARTRTHHLIKFRFNLRLNALETVNSTCAPRTVVHVHSAVAKSSIARYFELSVYLSVFLSVCLSVSVGLYLSLSLCVSVYLSVWPLLSHISVEQTFCYLLWGLYVSVRL